MPEEPEKFIVKWLLVVILLIEAAKEECFVFYHGPAHGESAERTR